MYCGEPILIKRKVFYDIFFSKIQNTTLIKFDIKFCVLCSLNGPEIL